MKFLYALSLACLLSGIGLFSIALAHETSTKGAATLFVHIDPTEPAVAGVPAMLYLNITNKNKAFAVEHCTCTLAVAHDGQEILSVPLVPSADPNTFGIEPISITFITEGTYDLMVHGEPISAGEFGSFDVDDDIGVLPAGATSAPSTHAHHSLPMHTLHLILLWGSIVAASIVVYRERKELFTKK